MRSSVRSLIITGCILPFLLYFLVVHTAFATTKHGCASPTPPGVAGTLSQATAVAGAIYINELLLTPHSTWNCSETNTYSTTNDSWLELYNPQAQPLDLYASHTSIDSGPNTNPFYLPLGSAIAAHGYLVVFPRTNANFLLTEGLTWRLLISGIPIDEVKLPVLGIDQSYARTPDGGNTWQITATPTIEASNVPSPITPSPSPSTGATTHDGSGTGNGVGTSTTKEQGGSGTGYGSTPSDQSSQIYGQQPSWDRMHGPSVTAKTLSYTTSSSPPSPTLPAMDTPRKIIVTVLVVALAFALIWCWRLFHHPSH